jgi:choline kinase
VRAVILAAGRGSRLGALTDDGPKGLVPLAGRPLLDRQIAALRAAGIDDIALVTGYRAERLVPYGLPCFHNPDWAETNIVASLDRAADWLSRTPCLVSYSDIFFEPAAPAMLRACDAQLAITSGERWREIWSARFADPLADAETFRVAPDGTLADIAGRPASFDEIEGQYMGLLRFEPAGWTAFRAVAAATGPDWRRRLHMTGALRACLDAGGPPVRVLRYGGLWGEVDEPSDLAVYARSDLAPLPIPSERDSILRELHG